MSTGNPAPVVHGNISKLHETKCEIEVDWKINDVLSHLNINSPLFTWSAVQWGLGMTTGKNVGQIGLFLKKVTSEKKIPVVYKFGIQKRDGTTEVRCTLTKTFSSAMTIETQELILLSELVERKHELLPDGILTLSCSVAHMDMLTKPQNPKYENLDVLISNFKALCNNTQNSDMTIIVGEKKYPVHKAILGARSDVFAAMFRHDTEEINTGIIKIADCDPTSFKDFLLYLYTGKVETFSWKNVCHLFKTADKYNVKELKELCIDYMKRNVLESATEFFDLVMLSNELNDTALSSAMEEVFSMNATEIIKEEGWEQLQKENFTVANKLILNMLEKSKDSQSGKQSDRQSDKNGIPDRIVITNVDSGARMVIKKLT